MKTLKRNCQQAFFASLLFATTYLPGLQASERYIQEGSFPVEQNWKQSSDFNSPEFFNSSPYPNYSFSQPAAEQNEPAYSAPCQMAWERIEDPNSSYPCTPVAYPPQNCCQYYSESSVNNPSPTNYQPSTSYGQGDIPDFNSQYANPELFQTSTELTPSSPNYSFETYSYPYEENQLNPNNSYYSGSIDEYQDSNLYHVPAELNQKPESEVYYQPQPAASADFQNGRIGFKEAKSHTQVFRKAVDPKDREIKTVADGVGKTTFYPPSIGKIDSSESFFIAEEDQSPPAKPANGQGADDSATKNFPAPTSKHEDAHGSSPSHKRWLTKAVIAQNDAQHAPSDLAPIIPIQPTPDPFGNPPANDFTQPPAQPTTPSARTTPSITPPETPRVIPSPTSTPTQTIITPTTGPDIITPEGTSIAAQPIKEISINFNNVAMVEFIRFISRISNKNFIFDEADLQFNVTIVSEEPTSIDNLMSALLQELRIRDLLLIEQGNNIIIHRNPRVRAPAHIIADGIPSQPSKETELVTQVFRLNTLDPVKGAEIIRPLLSDEALVEVLRDTNNIVITDMVANVNKIAQLINSLDAPNSGVIIGQYAVRNAFVDSLADLADRILQPIAQGNPFVLVPHPATNSIFVVSNPFIVERALAILENLDLNEGRTKIFTLEKLKLSNAELNAAEAAARANLPPEVPIAPARPLPGNLPGIGNEPIPPGFEMLEPPLTPGGITAAPRWIQELPPGHIERTLFFIYKLKYRRGDQIELALRKIGDSLLVTGTTNEDLIGAINSIQWLESSNSLIFTGTVLALDKVKELIEEIDVPLRQVFIEMLILNTTINDSLSYGVEWGSRFGGGNTAGSEAFLNSPFSPLLPALDSASVPSPITAPTPGPVATGLARTTGFSLGVVGRHLTHHGQLFNSIGALVTAIHLDSKVNIVLNPKIITEDNNTAEVFVGNTDRFKTQSISNDFGTVITNNFQFLDVGTTLRVTPLIGNNGIITLEIVQEITSESATANIVINNTNANDVNLIPILNKTRTLTRVHVPNGFFIVLSGMIQDTRTRGVNQLPCLGGIPLIGGVNKSKTNVDDKRNLMIFIRPLIIDTDEDLENITKRQQDVYREKSKFRRSWNYELDEALDFINIKRTDPDERGCTVK